MSCDTGQKRVSAASMVVGLAALTGKAAHVGGALLAQAGKTSEQAQNAAIKSMAFTAHMIGAAGPAKSRKDIGAGLVQSGVSRAAWAVATKNPTALAALIIAKEAQTIGDHVLSNAAAFTKTKQTGTVMTEKRVLFFFKSKTPVDMWQSSLTGLLNRRDAMGYPATASEGVMFQTGRQTWHRGTVAINTAQGERTMTHLQNLSLPQTHYYFNRPLSDEQAVGVATGQTKPENTPGFVGQVSATEGLCPGWAEPKQALIKAYLCAGPAAP